MNKRIITFAVAGAALLGLAGSAVAAPAVMNATANVRAGPGPYYQIIGKAYRGQTVDVQGCQSGWCYIVKRGNDGWIAARFLGRAPRGPALNFYFNFGKPPHFGPGPGPGPGPGGGFGPGYGGGPGGPPHP